MKYQLVTDRASKSQIVSGIADFEKLGFSFNGYNDNARQRKELQGQPKFNGLCGPMWNGIDAEGDAVLRYEDWGSYEVLSS